MIYIFEDGRILFDENLITEEDRGKFVEFSSKPIISPIDGKIGTIVGVNLKTKEVEVQYFDIIPPAVDPEIPSVVPQLSNIELFMQAMTDSELRDFEIQQGQELLAQKVADIELAMLGGKMV